ncbi:MAG TPA: Clp protease N-terminal domain-containing protein [Puia sp.]|nr:Clp protease N-terminal domain-containing protein [Puia sp.]
MNNNFSRQVKETISLSLEEAVRLGSDCIGTQHLLLGLIKEDHNAAVAILKNLQVALPELKKEIESSIESEKEGRRGNNRRMPLNEQAEKAIMGSVLQAKDAKSATVEPEHLMLSILKSTEDRGTKILNQYGVDYDKVVNAQRTSRE